MKESPSQTGLAPVNNARLYFEAAGAGTPFVMIHAGVADHRQWNNEFAHFSQAHRVVRYDLRGYGRSEPVDGGYSHLGDLTALLDHLRLEPPFILMGCSMGGGLALDFALERPQDVRALILVGAGPSGLDLDLPQSAKSKEAEAAYLAGDLDRVAELETQIWFDGEGRTPTQVDPAMRRLAYEMNRNALDLDARKLGTLLPNAEVPAAGRLAELRVPVLILVGAHDTPYIRAAAEYMLERLPAARRVVLEDAAHLPNMDRPGEFQRLVGEFLAGAA